MEPLCWLSASCNTTIGSRVGDHVALGALEGEKRHAQR
jgi:hypothetical protein